MATTSTVKRALAALAARTDVERGPYLAVIDEAEAALGDLDRAAGFVDSVGLDRLGTAIATAETAGNADAAERGADALETYRQFRRAAAGRLEPGVTDAESNVTDAESNVTDAKSNVADAESDVEHGARRRSG